MQFKLVFLCILIISVFISCNEQSENNGNKIDNIISKENILGLPDVIKDLPIGISVTNEPDTIYAELNTKGSKKYIWKHTTTVKAINTDIKILEFGTYNYKNDRWVLGDSTKKPYNSADFDKWYCRKKNGIITFDYCKEGYIAKNVEFIDPSNFCIRKDTLISRNGLWYYIGVDSSGKKVMGYGRYITIDKLK